MNTRSILISVAAIAMTFAGCIKEYDNSVEKTAVGGVVHLTATMESNDTKLTVGDGGSVVWSAGDEIAVYTTSGEFSTFTLTSGAGTAKAVFSGNGTPSDIAVYPATAAKSYTDGNLQINWPKEIAYSENGVCCPMIATISDGTLQFKHLGAVLQFEVEEIPSDAERFVLKVDENMDVAVLENATPGTSSCTLGTNASASQIAVTFEAGSLKSAKFFVPVPCGTYTGFAVELQDAEKETIIGTTKTKSSDVTTTRCKLISYPVYTCELYETVWKGEFVIDNWNGKTFYMPSVRMAEGDKIAIVVEPDTKAATYWILAVENASWKKQAIEGLTNGNDPQINLSANQTMVEFTLTAELANQLKSKMVLQGYEVTVKKILYKSTRDVELIWEGPVGPNTAWKGMSALAYGGYKWDTVSAGSVMTVYAEISDTDAEYDYGSVDLRVGGDDWANLTDGKNASASPMGGGPVVLELELSQSNLDEFVAKQGCVVGYDPNVTLKQIYLSAPAN